MKFFGRQIDERFLEHRRRSTSLAGIVAAELSLLLFAYRYYVNHRWSWDLLSIGIVFLATKLSLMTWYHLTD